MNSPYYDSVGNTVTLSDFYDGVKTLNAQLSKTIKKSAIEDSQGYWGTYLQHL